MEKKEFTALFEGTSVKAEGIWEAQGIAKHCMEQLAGLLRPGMTMEEIHDLAADLMTKDGSEGWWIHNDPALVLFADATTYSGRQAPSVVMAGKTVSENDMVTVDVAPTVRGGWGDATRAFFLKDGAVVPVEETGNPDWIEGMELERTLHARMIEFVDETTTFSQLHAFTEEILREAGYHNCDYHGNFGHTIENDQSERVTIIPEETRCIAAYGKPITYEPHICRDGGTWGVKHENMYVFLNGKMREIR